MKTRVQGRTHRGVGVALLAVLTWSSATSFAAGEKANDYFRDATKAMEGELYFRAARYAFTAQEEDASLAPQAYALITEALIQSRLYQAASYFFIRTLQTGNRSAIRKVLPFTERLVVRVGADLFRKYLIKHTTYADYEAGGKGAFLYELARDAVLAGRTNDAIGYVNGISRGAAIWPYALQLRGTARALLGKNEEAIGDFQSCQQRIGDYVTRYGDDAKDSDASWKKRQVSEAEDLQARCYAGEARTLYQAGKFDEADRVYDRIPKESLVWPDILFEQAWNSYARDEYNRALGKLVSYKAPALEFVYNPEVSVLRAQSFLALCLYEDADKEITEFNQKYQRLGEETKSLVERTGQNVGAFYDLGRRASTSGLYRSQGVMRTIASFARGPYFQNLLASDRAIGRERSAIRQFATMQAGADRSGTKGLPGFLDEVLNWRLKTIQQMGGAYVQNSLIDRHNQLISNFEKMSFIKLEMLRRSREQLLYKRVLGDRLRGNVQPTRRRDQLYWNFNGEFWNDELGDYVFGLESECSKVHGEQATGNG